MPAPKTSPRPEEAPPYRKSPAIRLLLVGPSSQKLLGGQEVQLDQLANDWSEDELVIASAVTYQPNLPSFLEFVEPVPVLRTIVRFPFYMASLWRAISEAEIVHAFSASRSSFLIATLPALLVARLRGRKTIVNYRSSRAFAHLKASAVSRTAISRTDCVVVASQYLANIFQHFGIQAYVVRNTVDLLQFPFHVRRPLRPRLLCTRNFYDCCGVDLVIRAFCKMKETFPEARLWLAGTGPQGPALRRLVQELRLEGVQFAGRVDRDAIGGLYAASDVFINASRNDNAPVSILEAFASGLPVITTAAGGIPEIVEQEVTGLLSEVGDWQGLAENAVRLLRQQALAEELSRRAHEKLQQHSWPVIRNRWLAIYESLCG